MNNITKIIILIVLHILLMLMLSVFSAYKPFDTTGLDFYILILTGLSIITYITYLSSKKYPKITVQIISIVFLYLVFRLIGLNTRINSYFILALYSCLLASAYHFSDFQFLISQRFLWLKLLLFAIVGATSFSLVIALIHYIIKLELSGLIFLSYVKNFILYFLMIGLVRSIQNWIINYSERTFSLEEK